MDVALNLIPVEPKINIPQLHTNSKSMTKANKSESGFAKTLNAETGKNETMTDSKTENDESAQLLTALASAVLPVAVTPIPVNQVDVNPVDGLESSATQLTNVVPNLVQTQLGDVVANVLGDQSSEVEGQLSDLIPTVSEPQSNDVAPTVAQSQLANAVLTAGMNTSPNQLATLLGKKTDTNLIVDNNKLGILVQTQMQSKSNLEENQTIEAPEINSDLLANVVPTVISKESSNASGKKSGQQLPNNKILDSLVDVTTNETSNKLEMLDFVNIKPIMTPQVATNLVENLETGSEGTISILGGTQEQLTMSMTVPTEPTINSDVFANVLNKQVIVSENQAQVPETKGLTQPVPDSYNVASQIIDQVRLVEGQKNTQMIIHLKPEHLGELTFKVTVENGIVSASFHSNNNDVRSIIESTLAQLKQDMSNQGLKIDNVGVYAGLGESFSNGQQSGGHEQPVVKVQNKKNEEEILDFFEATDSVKRMADGTGVDYRV